MIKGIKKLIILGCVAFACLSSQANACDDTLIMLLTAKNPTSEFSKTIRSFTNDLTILGTTLKAGGKDNYDPELKKVMESWLEFSKRYLTNPPEEAKNDPNWVEKTSQTARSIGEIRLLLNSKKIYEAHNLVLEMSSRIGAFFEAFGVSDEKKLFILASTNLTNLERYLLQNDMKESAAIILILEDILASYRPVLPETALAAHLEAAELLKLLAQGLASNQQATELDIALQKLKSTFEELRSHILMREWFPDATKH